MVKLSFKFRLVNLDNIVDSTCESIKDFLKYYGVKKFDDNDIVALQSLARNLFIKNRCSLDMHPAARLIAVREMDFVIEYNSEGKNYHALTLFDGAGYIL